jgi:hypothetical protein
MADKKIIKKDNGTSKPAWEEKSQTLPTPRIQEKPKTTKKKTKQNS